MEGAAQSPAATAEQKLRQAHASGERLAVVAPTLYRDSVRSPNELVQAGQFTQFSYGPGETCYAYAVGARNFISDSDMVAFSEVESLVF